MVCQACGSPVANEVRFCPRCGVQVAVPPPVYAAYPTPPMVPASMSRVRRHLHTLGILWCVFGAYRLVSGLAGIIALRVLSERQFNHYGWTWNANFHGLFWPPWISALVPLVLLFAVVTAALAFLVGFSLLGRRSWGRVLAIVVAILSLLRFPVGTVLGIYTLWVLIPGQSRAEYEVLADHS